MPVPCSSTSNSLLTKDRHDNDSVDSVDSDMTDSSYDSLLVNENVDSEFNSVEETEKDGDYDVIFDDDEEEEEIMVYKRPTPVFHEGYNVNTLYGDDDDASLTLPIFTNSHKKATGGFKRSNQMQKEAVAWLTKTENFFNSNGIRDEHRVWLAISKIKGDAYDWYIRVEDDDDFDHANWFSFKFKFVQGFCPDMSSQVLLI